MKRRMQVVMKAEELTKRIDEAIAKERAKAGVLGARLEGGEGDGPYGAGAMQGVETEEQLQRQRTLATDRVTEMTLLRDSLIANEEYVLSKSDLRCAGLISPERPDPSECFEGDWVDISSGFPIEGLKLTFLGEELRTLLEARQRVHVARAQRWKHELTRTAEDQTEDAPLLPDQICENEAEEEEWRAEVMAFIREHLEPEETYRLGKTDLEVGELLPEKPGWMQQEEYEERTGVAFHLERIARKL
jgi:hypothetical protein